MRTTADYKGPLFWPVIPEESTLNPLMTGCVVSTGNFYG